MSEETTTPADTDPELAENIARFKRGVEARVAEIKRDLAQWLDQTATPADYTPVSIALLELAFERYLAIDDNAADVSDLVQAIFRRVVRKRKGCLQ
jgi:hypothetical protein